MNTVTQNQTTYEKLAEDQAVNTSKLFDRCFPPLSIRRCMLSKFPQFIIYSILLLVLLIFSTLIGRYVLGSRDGHENIVSYIAYLVLGVGILVIVCGILVLLVMLVCFLYECAATSYEDWKEKQYAIQQNTRLSH